LVAVYEALQDRTRAEDESSGTACEQAPGEDADGKNFGDRETEEFGERSDRGGTGLTGSLFAG